MPLCDALVALFDFYEQFTVNMPLACEPGCATCCSVNVSVTSLETVYLRKHALFREEEVVSQVQQAADRPHFIPSCTTNEQAYCCLQKQNPPQESSSHAPGKCPLLDREGLCRVYTNRPFSCRAMLSTVKCITDGKAEMMPFIYTVNIAMYQMIEHLDKKGTSGNLLDMLGESSRTVANREIPGFLVAPQERVRFQRLLDKLAGLPVGAEQLADFFPPGLFNVT